jgi:hypothetical protein
MITKSATLIWMIAAAILGYLTFILPAMAQSDKESDAGLDEIIEQYEVYHTFCNHPVGAAG